MGCVSPPDRAVPPGEQLLSQRTALGGTFAHWDSWSSPGGLQVWGEGPAGAFAELGRTGTN